METHPYLMEGHFYPMEAHPYSMKAHAYPTETHAYPTEAHTYSMNAQPYSADAQPHSMEAQYQMIKGELHDEGEPQSAAVGKESDWTDKPDASVGGQVTDEIVSGDVDDLSLITRNRLFSGPWLRVAKRAIFVL